MHHIEKQIASASARFRLLARLHRTALVVALCTTLAGVSPVASGAGESPEQARIAVKERMSHVLAARSANGALNLDDEGGLFERFPLIATVGRELYRHDGDVAFLRQVHAASTAHLNAVLARDDADGDFLIDRHTFVPGGRPDLEGAGYNAMFALDMLSLSALCIELKLPVDALYWYQGARTVSARVIEATYDPQSGFFHPCDNSAGRLDGACYPMSAMPAFFRHETGDNIAGAALMNYALTANPGRPHPPYDLLYNSSRFDDTDAAKRLATVALLAVLSTNGLDGTAADLASRDRGTADDDYAAYFESLLDDGGYRTFFPRAHELFVLLAVAHRSGLIHGEKLAELTSNVNLIADQLIAAGMPGKPAGDTDELLAAIRSVYMRISEMREWWRKDELFKPSDRRRIPGFDANAAFDDLAQQAVLVLRDAENIVTRAQARARGFDVQAVLTTEVVSPGDAAMLDINLSALNQPVRIGEITVVCEQNRRTLMKSDEGIVVEPHATRTFEFSYLPRVNTMSMLLPIPVTVEVTLADGQRLRAHFYHSVYISPPVTFALSFPQGDNIRKGALPVELVVHKHVKRPVHATAEWFSPSGLRLEQGHSLDLTIPADTDELSMPLSILPPPNARPGAFPFVLKFFEAGQERGTIRAGVFKHYNWLYAGPFTNAGGLSTRLEPEHGVSLITTYKGARGPVRWATAPESMYGSAGLMNPGRALPKGMIGYLYTAVKSGWDVSTTVTFAAESPAVLMINGDPVVKVGKDELGTYKQVPVVIEKGLNNILVKIAASAGKGVYVQIGGPDDLAADEFNNNLWDLVDGYEEIVERSQDEFEGTSTSRLVTLRYQSTDASSVAVIGSFNGWSPVDTSMRETRDGVWEISLHLPPGRYAYRFLVNNDEQILDPSCSTQEPDGYGGMNSVLFVR